MPELDRRQISGDLKSVEQPKYSTKNLKYDSSMWRKPRSLAVDVLLYSSSSEIMVKRMDV